MAGEESGQEKPRKRRVRRKSTGRVSGISQSAFANQVMDRSGKSEGKSEGKKDATDTKTAKHETSDPGNDKSA